MSPEDFEALVRTELAKRDTARRARLGDRIVYTAADQACVDAIMRAAGIVPSEEQEERSERTARRRRRAGRDNEAAAFGEAS